MERSFMLRLRACIIVYLISEAEKQSADLKFLQAHTFTYVYVTKN
jgi:hypothetical protein